MMNRLLAALIALFTPLAIAGSAEDDSGKVASDLVQLAPFFDGTGAPPLDKLLLTAPASCPVQFATAALRYRADRDVHRDTFFAQLVIDDYAERAMNNYNVLSADEVRMAVDGVIAGYSRVAQRLQFIVAFCALKDKNLWISTQRGRISVARLMRGAALHAVLDGTDEDPLAIANAIDDQTSRRQTAP